VRANGLQSIADTAASRWFSPAFIEQQSAAVTALSDHLAGRAQKAMRAVVKRWLMPIYATRSARSLILL
jgi:hypothetical protein